MIVYINIDNYNIVVSNKFQYRYLYSYYRYFRYINKRIIMYLSFDEALNEGGFQTEVLYFEEKLLKDLKEFRFQEFTMPVVYDLCNTNANFKFALIDYICSRIGIKLEDFIDEIELSLPDDIMDSGQEIKEIFKSSSQRIQNIMIQFFYEILPFGFLIKISKKRGHKFDEIKEFLRDDIINLLREDIQKTLNIQETLSSVQSGLVNKEQLKKFNNLKNRQMAVSDKVIIENKFLIGLFQEISMDNLEALVKDLMDNEVVNSNLF